MSDTIIEIQTSDTIVVTETAVEVISVGVVGPVGPVGPAGPPGPVGADGLDGDQGPQGIQGPPGPTGGTGPAGSVGPAGPQGVQGPEGPQGQHFVVARVYASVVDLQADTNPTGISAGQYAVIDTGNENDPDNARAYLWTGSAYMYITDLSGIQGIQGPQGPTGVQGPTGAQGPQGVAGPAGPQGPQGVDGRTAYQTAVDNGFTGNETAWLLSLIGPQGPAGANGTNGIDGIDGKSVWIGDTAPVDNVQYPLWLRTTNGKLYGRVSAAWLELSQTGPAGPQGPAGANGTNGAQGPQGEQGPAGVNTWGSLTGDLANQTDLINALDAKAPSSHVHDGIYEPKNTNIQSHITNTSNPHSTSISQLGGVTITTPQNNNILKYNGSVWVNSPDPLAAVFEWNHTGTDVAAIDFPIGVGEYLIQAVSYVSGGAVELHFSKDSGSSWGPSNDFSYTYSLNSGSPSSAVAAPAVALTFLASRDQMFHEVRISVRPTGIFFFSRSIGKTTSTLTTWDAYCIAPDATGYNYARIAYAFANATAGSSIKVWKVG